MVVGFLFWFGLWSFSEKLFLRLFKTLAYSAACCSCKQGSCHSAPKGMQVRDVHLRSKAEWPNTNLNSPPKCSDIQRFSRETHLLFVSQLFEYLCTSKYSQTLYQNVTNTRFHLSCLPCYLISFIYIYTLIPRTVENVDHFQQSLWQSLQLFRLKKSPTRG